MGVVERVARTVGVPTRPGSAEVAESDNLEVLDKPHVDGLVDEVTEHGEAQFAVDDEEVVAVADVLWKAAHIGREGLIGVVLR